MSKKKKIYLSSIKKILLNRGYRIYKDQKNSIHKDFASFYYTAIISILLIFFFSLTPKITLLTDEMFYKAEIVENTSKFDFEKTLKAKKEKEIDLKPKEKVKLSFKDVYSDIEEKFDDIPSDLVRFKASTLDQLFKDTKYSLKKVILYILTYILAFIFSAKFRKSKNTSLLNFHKKI